MSLWPRSKSKVTSRFLKERFRSHQKSLVLIGCCKIIYRAISVVIFFSCVDAQVSCQDGSWSKINANWVIWVRGSDVARPNPQPPPMNPKETSLMTHPDASMKIYDINISNSCYSLFLPKVFL